MWNTDFHFSIQNHPPLFPILSQMNPIYALILHLRKNHQYYPLIYASAFEVTFLHQIYPRKHFLCVLLFSHAPPYMPSLQCYIIVDVKFSVIIFYSKASSTRTCINCVFRRIYTKIISFNLITKNVYMHKCMLLKVVITVY